MLLLAVVFLLGATLRVIGLGYGLPAIYNPDEIAIMNRALAFATGDLNPRNFVYPTFYFYVLFTWEGLAFVTGYLAGVFDSVAAFERSFFVNPTFIYVAGRMFSVVCGVLTIAATYALGRHVGGRTVGTAAAALLAVAPLAVRDAHYVKHDVPVTLLIVIAHIALIKASGANDGAGRWAFAGAVAGLALSTHYYAVMIAVPFLIVACISANQHGTAKAVRGLLVGALAGAAAVLVTSPFLFADPAATLADMTANRQIVIDRATDRSGVFGSVMFYLSWLVRDGSGAGAFLLAVIGTALVLARGARIAATVLAFPVAFLLFVANTVPASRYLNPILPFVAVLGGVAIGSLVRRGGWARAAALTLLILSVAEGAVASIRTDLFFRQSDTRTLALNWIERNIPADTTILVEPYSVPLRMSKGALSEALTHALGSADRASTKFQRILALDPYPAPAYRAIYLGSGGLDVDRLFVDPAELDGRVGLTPLRTLGVTHVILKREDGPDEKARYLEDELRRTGRLLAEFSPYLASRNPAERPSAPFLHNTDRRVAPDLERPGPYIGVWALD
jgi:hypothetical protein